MRIITIKLKSTNGNDPVKGIFYCGADGNRTRVYTYHI